MARRALVLGSQIEGLRGVDNDAKRVAAMLEARGFVVDLRLGAAGTRAGMLAGYDQLIEVSSSDDAAVVYYGGHGGHANVPEERRSWQCIAPTDVRDGNARDWRGITAWELSIKQAQLTARTRNVTVILDCCHSAQLSRSDGPRGALPRALPHPICGGFDRHLDALRATYGIAFDNVDSAGNPHAVRLVACGQSESAYEYQDTAGEHRGAFTNALIDVLGEVGSAPVSWTAIIGVVRARVLRRFVRQRPDVEGPARRGVFSLTEYPDQRSVPVTSAGERFVMPVGRLTGASVGDVYCVVPAAAVLQEGGRAVGELELVDVFATTATARRTTGAGPFLGPVVALPVHKSAARWAIAIEGHGAARDVVQQALAAAPTLRPSRPDDVGVVATVRVDGDAATIEDCRGALSPHVLLPSGLGRVLTQLASLGVAQGIRELEGDHGMAASEVAIELGIVRDGRPVPLADHGAIFALRDCYYLNIVRVGQRTVFVHVLNFSATGKVTLLTQFNRRGVVLDHRAPSVMLGQRTDGAILGVGVHWPEGLPRSDVPLLMELVVIVTLTAVDLSGLETGHFASTRDSGNSLSRILAELCDGAYRGGVQAPALDGFLVKRVSILLDSGLIAGDERYEAGCQ